MILCRRKIPSMFSTLGKNQRDFILEYMDFELRKRVLKSKHFCTNFVFQICGCQLRKERKLGKEKSLISKLISHASNQDHQCPLYPTLVFHTAMKYSLHVIVLMQLFSRLKKIETQMILQPNRLTVYKLFHTINLH